ncbi:hypothetical protein ACF0H5_017811 [Mactra antiquata]
MWRLFVILGLYGCVQAGQILSPIDNTSNTVTTQSSAANVKTVIDGTVDLNKEIKSPTTIENKNNPDSLTANSVNNVLMNKNTMTTTMVSAAVKDLNNNAKDTNVNSPNKETNKDTNAIDSNVVETTISIDSSKGRMNEESRSDIKNKNNVPTREELIAIGTDNVNMVQHRIDETFMNKPVDNASAAVNEIPSTAIKNRDNVPTRDELIANGVDSVDMVQHRINDDGFMNNMPINNKPKVTNTEPSNTGIKNRDNVPTRDELIANGVDNVDMAQHRINDDGFMNNMPINNKPKVTNSETSNTGIKNRDNVPTRNELIEMGADNVNMVQHRTDDTFMTKPVDNISVDVNEIPSTAIKNSGNVPTREELIANGVDNVDMVQHRINDDGFMNKPVDTASAAVNEISSTAIKNRDNVPTRDELIANGVDNVDMVQHRMNDDGFINKPVDTASAAVNEIPSTAIKNRDNVPTRNELITNGVDNVDMVQHRINDDGFMNNMPINNKPKVPNTEPSNTGIKNRDNVQTRDELIAYGVDNVDMVQHRINDDGFINNMPINNKPKVTNTEPSNTGIKNRDNVPTRNELIEMGADNVNMVQHRTDDTFMNKPVDNISVAVNEIPSTAIKNRDNVPTRDELIANGVDNVDMVQHRINDDGFMNNMPINNKPKVTNTEPSNTGIKNRDNVPTRDELIANGVDNVDMVQHRINDDGFINNMPINNKPKVPNTEPSNTGIKNRDNVPTRNELIEMGAENVNMVQHRTDDTFMNMPVDKSTVGDKKSNAVYKNRENVPTRNELVEMGAENVDMLQHRLDDKFINSMPINNKPITSNVIPSTAIKNRDNVPTRDELIAAGVENVDMVQHRVDDTFMNKPLDKSTVGDKTIESSNTGIKNRDNVPTRNELIEMGAENVDIVQHRIEDTIDLNWLLKKKESTTIDVNIHNKSADKKSPSNINGNTNTGIKNKDNVPTKDELLASGVTNAHMLQHRKEFRPKGIVNLPQDATDPTTFEKDVPSNVLSQNSKINGLEQNAESQIKNESGIQVVTTKNSLPETTTFMSATTTTSVQQQKINKQIAVPKHTTLTSPTGSDKHSTNGGIKGLDDSLTPKIVNNKEMTEPTLVANSKVTKQKVCPMIKCAEICEYGYKEDNHGCQTCTCKHSNSCPRAVPISGLLCLLQVRTSSSQNCVTDSDCRRNRICCPGTCGTICRRQSRNRSLLLSMLLD